MKVLLGITGSVAAKLAPKIVKELQDNSHDVMVIVTESAKHFLDAFEVQKLLPPQSWWHDKHEFPLNPDWVNDDGTMFIPHIHLKDWADVFVIAPLTANTLAKISHGIADNLLTCTFRAWSKNKPIVLAPAMNTDMWNHQMTYNNLHNLAEGSAMWFSDKYLFGAVYTDYHLMISKSCGSNIYVVMPVEKKLACGQEGRGALAPISDIVGLVNKL